MVITSIQICINVMDKDVSMVSAQENSLQLFTSRTVFVFCCNNFAQMIGQAVLVTSNFQCWIAHFLFQLPILKVIIKSSTLVRILNPIQKPQPLSYPFQLGRSGCELVGQVAQ